MSRPVIAVEDLGKSYRIGAAARHARTFRESLVGAARAPLRRLRRAGGDGAAAGGDGTFWALRHVDFAVAPGEVVGFIGHNGAGKSTLLKILSRITDPTEGTVRLRGRMASLLEVGTGFHPELTGRENVFLNGSILGMSRAEIARKFDEIVAFSGVERFLDTPVKRYSSGMYVRLAFAVAANLESEVLVIDEVLAVGDAEFQKKCLSKMGEVAGAGRTVLFVSHSMAAVAKLCDRAVVMRRGAVEFAGDVPEAMARYLDDARADVSGAVDLAGHPKRRPGCEPMLRRCRLLDAQGRERERFFCGEAMAVELSYDPLRPAPLVDPQFGVGVDDAMGVRVYSLATYLSDARLPPLPGPARVTCAVDSLDLPPGRYRLSLSVGTRDEPLVDALDQAVAFDVELDDYFGNGRATSREMGFVLKRSRWDGRVDA